MKSTQAYMEELSTVKKMNTTHAQMETLSNIMVGLALRLAELFGEVELVEVEDNVFEMKETEAAEIYMQLNIILSDINLVLHYDNDPLTMAVHSYLLGDDDYNLISFSM